MAFNSPPLNFLQGPSPLQPAIAAQEPSGTLVLAGLCAIGSGVLGCASWLSDDGRQTTLDQAAIIIAALGAIVGGVLAVRRRSVGAAIGLGGAVFFSNHAIALAGQQFDFDQTLDPTSSKVLVVSGVVGLVAIGLGLTTFRGRTGSALGVVVAAVAFVPAVATGALVHLDDAQEVYQLGIVGGYVLVALVVLIGGLRGRWGVLASVVAAVAHLPLWIETANDVESREAAAWAGLVAFASVAVLGAIATHAADSIEPTNNSSNPSPGYAPAWAARPTSAPPQFGPPQVGRPSAAHFGGSAGQSGQSGGQSSAQSGGVGTRPFSSAPVVSGQWAADPYGRFQSRYWNGTQWTEHVSSNGVNAIDPI